MCVSKPVTDSEWTFEVIGGPSEEMMYRLRDTFRELYSFEFSLLGIPRPECLSEELHFSLKPHPFKWIDTTIRVRIIDIKVPGLIEMIRRATILGTGVEIWSARKSFEFTGFLVNPRFKQRPFAFTGEYNPPCIYEGRRISPAHGTLAFSFEHGVWLKGSISKYATAMVGGKKGLMVLFRSLKNGLRFENVKNKMS